MNEEENLKKFIMSVLGSANHETVYQKAGEILEAIRCYDRKVQIEMIGYVLREYDGKNIQPTNVVCEIPKISETTVEYWAEQLKQVIFGIEIVFQKDKMDCHDLSRLILEVLEGFKNKIKAVVFFGKIMSSNITPFNFIWTDGALSHQAANRIRKDRKAEIEPLIDTFYSLGVRYATYPEQAKAFMDKLRAAPPEIAEVAICILLQHVVKKNNGPTAIAISREALMEIIQRSGMEEATGHSLVGKKSSTSTMH